MSPCCQSRRRFNGAHIILLAILLKNVNRRHPNRVQSNIFLRHIFDERPRIIYDWSQILICLSLMNGTFRFNWRFKRNWLGSLMSIGWHHFLFFSIVKCFKHYSVGFRGGGWKVDRESFHLSFRFLHFYIEYL